MIVNLTEHQNNQSLHPFNGKKILITGASGFVGFHLCRALGSQGAEIFAVSRNSRTSDADYLSWCQADLGSIEQVRNVVSLARPNVVFHLASIATGRHGLEYVLPMFHGNLTSTVNLLTAVTEFGGCDRIVLASSLEEPELDEVGAIPHSPYGAAKWASSNYGRMFHRLYQAPVSIARLFMIYGPAQPDINKLIPYTILSLLRGEAPRISSGKREVDWIYIDDVISGLLALAQTSNMEGRTVDLGSGSFVSIHSVVDQLVELMGSDIQPLYGVLPDRPQEPRRVANTAHTYQALRWEPKILLRSGLQRTIDWYQKHIQQLNQNA